MASLSSYNHFQGNGEPFEAKKEQGQGVMMNNNSRSCSGWRRERGLQSLASVLLALILPVSFLLLFRLSAAQSYLYDFDATAGSDDFLAFLFLYANSTILYGLLTLITLAAFVHCLTGGRLCLIQQLFLSSYPSPAAVDDDDNSHRHRHRHRPGWGRSLSVAWLLLCTSLVFAELGIELELNDSDATPIPTPSSSSYDHHGRRWESFSTNIIGLLFAVGLYETMLYWSKSVVKPVVEHTLMMMGFRSSSATTKEEEEIKITWFERVGLGLSFGALWWWRLRDRVDSLVITAAADDQVADFVGLGLYCFTVCIGVIRAWTGVMWVSLAREKILPTAEPKPCSPLIVITVL